MEFLDTIRYVFNVCIGVGFAVPLISLLIGTFGSMLDIDVDLDTDTQFGGPIPFNLMCLCFSFIVFGALGRFSMRYMEGIAISVVVVILLLLFSFLGYLLFYRLVILKLKANSPTALKSSELAGKKGIITLRVTGESDGTISIEDNTGAKITYRARIKSDMAIEGKILHQGEEAVITDYNPKENICYVDKLSN